jgi:hypothetical protein
VTEGRNDGEFFPYPSTPVDNITFIFIKMPIWRHLSFQIDVYALENWLNLLEGYFFVHNFFDMENITFTLLKDLPHVKHWWETYMEKSSTENYRIYGAKPNWDFFVDVVKEQYYRVGDYDDQYMRWTKLQK